MARAHDSGGYRSTFCRGCLAPVYRATHSATLRLLLRRAILKLEGGPLYSLTIRELFRSVHDLDIGLYTVVGHMNPDQLSRGTVVGRYSSIYHTVRSFSGNHPLNTKSTHAFFYNPALGKVSTDVISRTKLQIGNDVWIGHNAVILSSVTSIGDGAVIGAGSIVSTNVPPYAIVTGFPARIVRYRFPAETIATVIASRWWLKDIDALLPEIESFRTPLDGTSSIR